ncbi:hypothetical protein MNB_SV-10-939 [hydrothermal vent metagenome]|uniref:Uncharacterized protein n=1 Tax=hydrothermal vent metagenome TaxID=652676 RepID=A0A1W1BRB2_9ZZZZ
MDTKSTLGYDKTMKEIVEFLQHKNIVFKSLNEISPKELGSRKKIALYVGVDLQDYYALVMQIEKKSRILRKEATELMELHEKLEKYLDTKITKKYIIIKAPLCSKAKALLETNGWNVWQLTL